MNIKADSAHRKTQDLVNLVRESRSVFSSFAKAKSSKLGTLHIAKRAPPLKAGELVG